MAEEIKKTKKIEELKNTPENKAAIAKAEGKVEEKKSESNLTVEKTIKQDKKDSEKKEKSSPAVTNVSKKDDKKKEVVELEREYIVPMRKGSMNVPAYRRAKKAVKTLKEFMVRHMNIRDGDLRKVKVDINLNNEIWFRGIKKPLHKIKVRARKVDGVVYVTLVDIPEVVAFKIAREAKKKAAGVKTEGSKVKAAKVQDKDKDGVDDATQEKEDAASEAEKDAKAAKIETKAEKHTAQGKHKQKTAPVRKVLK